MNAAKMRRNRAKAKLLNECVDGIEPRFWGLVNKTDGCWEWTGGLHRGYGRIVYRCQELETHRVSWKLANGAIPDGLWVLHHCDNRKCVRPDHLFLGTPVDNNLDRDRKGRQAKGDRSGARLHPERVPRGDRSGSRLHPERLVRGDAHWTRKHPERIKPLRGDKHPTAKLKEAQAIEIRRRYNAGESRSVLASEFGIRPNHVFRIATGRRWGYLSA